MKTKALVTMLLLLLCTAIFASEDAGDAAEHARKTQELNQLAERFKADTGFRGEIVSCPEQMKLSRFSGSFDDVNMKNVRDSVAFRQVCNNVINKLLPYIGAASDQLVPGVIHINTDHIYTRYYQNINGYKLESGGYINIYYVHEQKRFGILNVTETIRQHSSKILARDEVNLIVLNDRNDGRYRTVMNKGLLFSRKGSEEFYLAYKVILSSDDNPIIDDHIYWVNAEKGKIMFSEKAEIHRSDIQISVNGRYYSSSYVWDQPSSTHFPLEMEGVRVRIQQDSTQTDATGIALFENVTYGNQRATLENSLFKVTCFPDTVKAIYTNTFTPLGNDKYHVSFGDTYSINGIDLTSYSPNTFMEAYEHIKRLNERSNGYFENRLNIITRFMFPGNTYGGYSNAHNMILIREGRLHDTIRHELSHHFVACLLNTAGFAAPGDSLHAAMDEAAAIFFGNSPTDTAVCPALGGSNYLSSLNPLLPTLSLNETLYSQHSFGLEHGLAIASAWWSLRDNSIFGLPNPATNVKAFDEILVNTIEQDVDPNFSQVYKPRYFYNILMNRVDDGSAPHSLNPKQKAINEAYESRGFHFTPKVESFSEGNRSRNVFSPGDQVHAKITKAPQNTAFTVYVIRHGDYTYVDGANVSTLAPHYDTDVFTPITGNSTDAGGNWDGLIWTIPSEAGNVDGGYDIIVNFGSPDAPDNQIHFSYTAANVMDGIDGFSEPGFTVYDDRIDIVVAVDTALIASQESK
jgi:hypothetical protein